MRARLADAVRNTGEHALKLLQWRTDAGHLRDAALADGALMVTAALFHHRDRLPHGSSHEVAEEHDGIGEIAHVSRLIDGAAEDPPLHEGGARRHAASATAHQVEEYGKQALLGIDCR